MIRLLLLIFCLSCVGQTVSLQAAPVDAGVAVEVAGNVASVSLWDDSGALVLRQPVPPGANRAFLAISLDPGRYRVTGGSAEAWFVARPSGPVDVLLEAPVGQGRREVADGDVVSVLKVAGGVLRAAVVLTAREPIVVRVRAGDRDELRRLDALGDRATIGIEIGDEPVHVHLEVAGEHWSFEVHPQLQTLDSARAAIVVSDVALPTDPLGSVDRARPPDRVTLPSAWWRAMLRRTGLGYRPRDDQAPWTWQTITLENRADAALNVVVRARILDDRGEIAEGFRPMVRDAVADEVQVLLRLPPGREVRASLPVFVRGESLVAGGRFLRQIEVIPLGASAPLHVIERPLYFSTGSRWASSWLVVALSASGLGWAWLLIGARRWIGSAPTADLVTIGLFGSVTWVAGTALQVAGLGVSAVLGPFSPLLTGIADDALRACLLGTLIALVPRPGTAALATAVGFVMRGLTMGTFHPVDLLYLGSAVFWLELWLWIAGCTRGDAWRDRDWEHWARLCVGLGVSNVCAAATALVVSVVFYRLYFADWYVVLILVFPGFLYVCLGCWPAVGFSRALRRVEG